MRELLLLLPVLTLLGCSEQAKAAVDEGKACTSPADCAEVCTGPTFADGGRGPFQCSSRARVVAACKGVLVADGGVEGIGCE
jgi:hypothetical protein